jgi:NADH:ubiquinone oxidoreductase subunit B-like Fe-S oxidoreductase
MAHHDLDRFGIVGPPRQCDDDCHHAVTRWHGRGTACEQMPTKWWISMGACAANGGPYTAPTRPGVDKIIPWTSRPRLPAP